MEGSLKQLFEACRCAAGSIFIESPNESMPHGVKIPTKNFDGIFKSVKLNRGSMGFPASQDNRDT